MGVVEGEGVDLVSNAARQASRPSECGMLVNKEATSKVHCLVGVVVSEAFEEITSEVSWM